VSQAENSQPATSNATKLAGNKAAPQVVENFPAVDHRKTIGRYPVFYADSGEKPG
jgi:hypothetical protein